MSDITTEAREKLARIRELPRLWRTGATVLRLAGDDEATAMAERAESYASQLEGCLIDTERDLLALLESVEQERGWRPIETAPTDGTRVLLYVAPQLGRVPYAVVDGFNLAADRRGWRSFFRGGVVEPEPTHWMPLPAQLQQDPS